MLILNWKTTMNGIKTENKNLPDLSGNFLSSCEH
jgi:hypothetical protein